MPCDGCQRRAQLIKAHMHALGKGASDWLREGLHRAGLANPRAINAKDGPDAVATYDDAPAKEAPPPPGA